MKIGIHIGFTIHGMHLFVALFDPNQTISFHMGPFCALALPNSAFIRWTVFHTFTCNLQTKS